MIKNIIFDWSGTLSDDFSPVYKASKLVFQKLGHPGLTEQEFKSEFQLPVIKFYKQYFPDLTRETSFDLFIEEFNKQDKPIIYKGVRELIEVLYNKGINMIILSSHPQPNIEQEAKDYQIFPYLKQIYGGVIDKTQAIQNILINNNFKSNETAFVGDMIHDIEAGKEGKVKTIAITWGYDSPEKLKTANPDFIIKSIEEIESII